MEGLDIVRKLSTAKGQFKYIIVAIDYDSKWIEAEPLTALTTTKVESANKIIKKLLKKKLEDKKGLWAEKLPEVLWAIRTIPTSANGETPFCMMFGIEAVLPIEVTQPTARIDGYDAMTNVTGVNLDKDLLEEKQDRAHLHNLQNKQRVSRFYDNRVKARNLQLGDWVMKEVILPPKALRPTWERPYQIVEVVSPGTFYLKSKEDVTSTHPWNTQHLRYYYK
ncbi:uncharacterized protein LOC112183949 [Rosa chinensis]|uniref:uncharacterized protein LOC112183949 n=1 Tax=Rosa chinensis TaxID=74649 RepID=UPI000D08E6E9|nr:uncharacterized protein LOC112183949 [Rosa chinensis]